VRKRRRRDRSRDVTCECSSYTFPHRQTGGRCTPLKWVTRFFNPTRADCRECLNRDDGTCQVVEQVEEPFHCPELRSHVSYHAIALYGRARESAARSTRGNQ